jgi:sporulation protein YlmC with PRC-barrel domain
MLKNVGIASALVLSLAAAPAFAQTTQPAETPATSSPAQMNDRATTPGGTAATDAPAAGQPDGYIARQMEGEHLASNLLSKKVYNNADEEIGTISDLVMDAEGKITAVIIGVGGFLGVGQKNVAISFANVQETTKDNERHFLVNMTKEQLDQAPSYTTLEDRS